MQFPLTDLPSPFRRSKQQVEEGKGEEASRGNTWAYVEAIDISDEGNNSAYEHANFAPKQLRRHDLASAPLSIPLPSYLNSRISASPSPSVLHSFSPLPSFLHPPLLLQPFRANG